MDQSAVERYLTQIRTAGDAEMRRCSLVTDALLPIPAQHVGIAHLFLRPRFLLADPTGSGKTPTAVAAYGYLKEKDAGLKLLVVTTRAAQFQWKRQIELFLTGMTVEVLGYLPNKQRLSPTARQFRYQGPAPLADVWITTYKNLSTDEQAILQAWDNFVLVLDEVHWVKSSQQDVLYPAALHASQKARSVWGLSATPMKNDRLEELFSVMEVVRPGTFGGSYAAFRRLYYLLRLVKPRWTVKQGPNKGQRAKPFYEIAGYQNQDHLRAVIAPFYLRRPLEAFKRGLPSLTYRIEDIFLDQKQQKLYDDIWTLNWPGKDGEKLLKIAALTKAQQALGAPELLGPAAKGVPNAKLAALITLCQTELQDQKVIVYSKFVQVVEAISKGLTAAHLNHCRITGADTVSAQDGARHRFQIDPAVKLILLTDAGGEALDLQAADVVLFYDLPWSHGSFVQVIGRARRLGSQHPNVLALLFGAPRTCDVLILSMLTRKEQLIRSTLQQGNLASDSLLSSLSSSSTSHSDLDALFSSLSEGTPRKGVPDFSLYVQGENGISGS